MKRAWQMETGAIDHRKLPVIARPDILVVGGGPAGVAAAVTAAEQGFSVLLVEKYGFCGGAAVAGYSATVCGLYVASDYTAKDAPKPLVHGFAGRFCDALEAQNGITAPQLYGKTFVRTHEAHAWKRAADGLLESAGVEVLYHTSVIGSVLDGKTVRGVVASSAAGLGVILALRIIDCSGDAAVVAMSGGAFFCGQDGAVQNPTLIFKLSNVDAPKFWAYYGEDTICPDHFSVMLAKAEGLVGTLPRKKVWIFQGVNESELVINATAIVHPQEKLNAIYPEHITFAEIEGRRQMLAYARAMMRFVPGCEQAYIGEAAAQVGVRQTRSIKGVEMLLNRDVESCRKRPDGIAKSSWPIELHKVGGAPKLHWLIDDYYEVPFGALVPQDLDGIIVAGRCLCAEHEALASARVTAQCFEYGRAAAVGSALSIKSNLSFAQLDGKIVREKMQLV